MIARPAPSQEKPPNTPPMRAGANVLMGRNPLGMWMDGPSGKADFSHPFTVQAGGAGARVGKGLVIGNVSVEPVIGKAPIGGDGKTPPVLKLNASLVNDRGESWVCVEVTPDDDGKLDGKKAKIEVVQRDHPIALTGKTGRTPLAMLLRKNDSWRVFQIAMFHLRYETSLPAKGPRTHFFL